MTAPFTSESQRYEYPFEPHDLVIDAGGYEGEWSDGIAERYRCRVITLEPVKEFYDKCVARLAKHPTVDVQNVALGAFTGEIDIGVSNNSSGLYSGGPKITVKVKTLEDIIPKTKTPFASGMKLNVEGLEYAILEQIIKSGFIKRVRHIQVQWHWSPPRAEDRYHAIRSDLLKTHDHIWGEDPTLWQSYSRRC